MELIWRIYGEYTVLAGRRQEEEKKNGAEGNTFSKKVPKGEYKIGNLPLSSKIAYESKNIKP